MCDQSGKTIPRYDPGKNLNSAPDYASCRWSSTWIRTGTRRFIVLVYRALLRLDA